MSATSAATALLPFQPDAMTPAQLAAVSYRARYTGHTHNLYAAALRRWFGWCEGHARVPVMPRSLRSLGSRRRHDRTRWRSGVGGCYR